MSSSSDPSQGIAYATLLERSDYNAQLTSSIIQSVCLVGKGRLKERCELEPPTNFFFLVKKSAKTSAD
jgi:hypothetical protein